MQRIELQDGAYLELDPEWLPEADAVQLALMREIPFEARAIKLFGREVMQPRLVAWVGDAEAVYAYSGVRHEPLPWTPTLRALRAKLAQSDLAFNGVLCNLYRDGRDSMGLHSDSEPELGPDPIVASLSLGATRRFQLRHRRSDHALEVALTHGSLLVMRGTTQRFYRHAVPKQRTNTAPRIN
ncbi:MAG TPA: alpha-ketoglutarate-dependent dioxygenase AlkB, partial [Polyangiales bacterium]|nr:alpha-ketoglutarate-dependent dioxygenase AlkB [Polyangiales bacterium]